MSRCPYTWFMGVIKKKSSAEEAQNLRVTVVDGDVEKVNVILPAKSARWLISLIPESVMETIRREGIPIEEIQEDIAKKEILNPQGLFFCLNGNKKIDVWLE